MTTKKSDTDSNMEGQNSVKASDIKQLLNYISSSGLNEVNIETKDLKLYVKKEPTKKLVHSGFVEPSPIAASAPTQIASAPPEPTAIPEKTPENTNQMEIKSPMIGTFYRSSTPENPPFVTVGDVITKGQVICIIEAMKLFNEIEAEESGTIVKVLVENSTPVEFDQVLFVIEPN